MGIGFSRAAREQLGKRAVDREIGTDQVGGRLNSA
jgi:hypothetical protein